MVGRLAASTLVPREATRPSGYRSHVAKGAPVFRARAVSAADGFAELRGPTGDYFSLPWGPLSDVRPRSRSARLTLRRLLVPVSLLLLSGGCRFGAPPGATEQGQRIGNLYHLMFYIAIGVAAVVYGLVLWCIVRYRRRSDADLPPQFRYHIPLEVTYTVIPILIVIGIFVATFRAENRVDAVAADPKLVVNVTAFQWQWRFQYPQQDVEIVGSTDRHPVLVLPAGQTVRVNLNASDVNHAFFVPAFLFKRDAIPGIENHFDLNVTEKGIYQGECAEFCGLNHADMYFSVKAVPPSQFASALQQEVRRSASAGSGS
jgi:cytochrome c oxidase subunit 2